MFELSIKSDFLFIFPILLGDRYNSYKSLHITLKHTTTCNYIKVTHMLSESCASASEDGI